MLASKDKVLVEQEASEKTQPLAETTKEYLRDPYILDFLNLQDKTYQESDLEQAIISNLQQFLLELGKGFAFVERHNGSVLMMTTRPSVWCYAVKKVRQW